MFRKISPWIALLMLVVSDSSMALGLGDIKLNSSLNQPFNAEIRLLSADSLAKSQIVINLASQEEFNRAGVEHYFFLRSLKFVPVVKSDGSVVVKVTSKEAIKEPFLDFLVEVNWPNGRIIREYTVLLDPPAFSEVEMTSAPEAAESTSNNNFQPKKVETNTIVKDDWSGDDSSSDYSSTDDSESDSYRVKNADTLWGIARKNRNQNTSIQQTMVAIFNANPSAFTDSNMNQLKRGSVLQLDANQAGLSQQQALLEIARQNQLWGGRGNAGTRPDAVIDTADYASTSTTGSRSEPRLKLAAVGEGDSGGSSSALESEAVTTLSEENQSLRSRVETQNERIDKLERLIELQNSEMAAISDNADTVNERTETTSQNPDTASNTNSTEAEIPSLDITDTAANTEIADDPLNPTGAQEEAVDPQDLSADAVAEESTENLQEQSADTTATDPKPPTNINTAPALVQKEQSILDVITNLSNSVWLAIGSGIFVLFFSFLYIRRRNMADEEFQESLVVPVTQDLEDDIQGVGDEILAAEMGVDHDYIPEAELDNFDDDAVDSETNADPLGEADVYLAYGKFDQAERILRDALEEEPERLDLRLKIMECFAETKSLSEFKDQKREILEVLATDDTVAEQVNLMERQAWPEEQEKDDLPSTEDIFGDLSFGNDDESTDELSFPDENDKQEKIEPIDESDLDQALEMSSNDSEEESAKSDSDDVISTEDEFIDADLDIDDDSMDFTADADEETPINTDEVEETPTEDVDFISESELMDAELDDELDDEPKDEPIDESILDLGDIDEASTKLDLARAYIDMEDFEGASEILQEVVNEGSPTQKSEAEELLDKMK